MSFFGRVAQATGFGGRPAGESPNEGALMAPSAGNPLQLVSYDSTSGKFEVGQEAIKVLKGVKGPVGVVSVCGRARQGKSFILNQLLGQSSGFQVAPTHRPCTKGLWMWSTPVPRKQHDGSTYHLVLLDTEGIDAYDQTGQYSTQIFSLAVLLSSLFVYNQMGGIDEAALDRLSLVTEMTKNVRVRAGSTAGETAEAELAEFTPAFLWLLRDFYLTLEEGGRQLTPREYLEIALAPLAGGGRAAEAKNSIRASIKALFPHRDCFALVRPMSDERALANLEAVPPGQLRPEFREGLARLTRLIFARAQPKRLGQHVVSGAMLGELAKAYVAALNAGAVPTISTAWQGVAEAECRRAGDAAEAAYQAAFDKSVAADEARLEAEHARALAAAQAAFKEVAIGDAGVQEANEKRYRERCEAQFQALKRERLASAELECQKILNAAAAALTQAAGRPGTSVEALQAEMARQEAGYRANPAAAGPHKWRLLSEFTARTYAPLLRQVAAAAEAAEQKRAAAAADRARQAEARAEAAQREAAQLRALQQDLQGRATSAASAHQDALRAKEAELARATDEAAQQRQRAERAERELADATARAQKAVVEAQQARHEALAAQSRLDALNRDASKSGAEAQALGAALQAARDGLARAEAERNQAHRDATGKAAALLGEQQAREAAEAAMQRERGALGAAQAQLAEAGAALAAERNALSTERSALAAARAQVVALTAQLAGAPAAPAPDADMANGEDGYETPDEAGTVPEKMTIRDLKAFLTDHGQEQTVWQLSQSKAKKPAYVAAVHALQGQ